MTRLWLVLYVAGLVAYAAVPVFADFYDNFDDGTLGEDPNGWDIDDPCWIIYEPLGDPNKVGVDDGWLRMWTAPGWMGVAAIIVYTDTGDHDPNTSETYWGHMVDHYILARTKYPSAHTDPNLDTGSSALLLHANPATWLAYGFEYPYHKYGGGAALPRIVSAQGLDWPVYAWKHIEPTEPNHPDEANGFWMLFQYGGTGNPDPYDPNGAYLRAALWNGDKFDWDGQWFLEVDLSDPCSWQEPIIAEGEWWCPVGRNALAGEEFRGGEVDTAFDQVEARTGVFSNIARKLRLLVTHSDYGTVALEPNLVDPADPNLQRYTDGTEIVLSATPISGKAFGSWTIWDDPNRYPDSNYAVVDSNFVLYLTMDHDYTVEAAFKCGSGVSLLVGIALPLLGAVVLVRRFA